MVEAVIVLLFLLFGILCARVLRNGDWHFDPWTLQMKRWTGSEWQRRPPSKEENEERQDKAAW